MITQVWQWLTSAASWQGPNGIAQRLLEHLEYSVLACAIGALIAVPLGLWVGHTGRGRTLVTGANSLRAVPSLGLLFIVALWLGTRLQGNSAFLIPSLIVLVIMAIPPLLAGVYAGISGIDPEARDAAHGMGMTQLQVLTKVEVPCALPLILSGLRSAMLQVIATATIAAFISLGGLGQFLVNGLALGKYQEMAGGAIMVAALALAVDGVLAVVTHLVVSPGLDAGGRRGWRRKATTGDRSRETGTPVPTT